jgi:trans-aconitate methyltransferase
MDPAGERVVDIGCSGGTYTRAWHELGAASVTGVDESGPILDSAQDGHGKLPGVGFVLADARATGLASGTAGVVFERALVHTSRIWPPSSLRLGGFCGPAASTSSRTGLWRT